MYDVNNKNQVLFEDQDVQSVTGLSALPFHSLHFHPTYHNLIMTLSADGTTIKVTSISKLFQYRNLPSNNLSKVYPIL